MAMNIIVHLLLLCFIQTREIQAEVALYPTGETAVLSCGVTLTEGVSLTLAMWRKVAVPNDITVAQYLLGTSSTGPDYTGRASVNATGFLLLHNVTQEDDGEYRCQPTLSDLGITPAEVRPQLQVADPPGTPTLSLSPNPVCETQNQDVQLTCSVTSGTTPFTYTFYHGDTQLASDGSASLTLSDVDRNQAGTYTCTVSNVLGEDYAKTSSEQTLVVHYLGTPQLTPSSPVTIVENSDLSVVCSVTSVPASPTLHWSEDGTNEAPGATLRKNPVSKNDAGTYTCTATNMCGAQSISTSTQLVVDVQYAPDVTSPPTRTVNEGDNLTATCQVMANPAASSVRWTRSSEGGSTAVSDSATLSITNISRTAAGTYVCTAQNTFHDSSTGTGTSNTVVIVQYKPSEPTITINPSPVVEDQTVTLTCRSTSALPDPSYSWKFTAQGLTEQDVSFGTTTNNGGTLTIAYVQRALAGQYRCTATNVVGQTDSDLTELVVYYPPSVDTFTADPDPAEENSPVTLTCTVDSNPAPNSISIVRVGTGSVGDVTLATGQGMALSHTIQDVSYTDTGTYRCQAGNGIGTDATKDLGHLVNYVPVFVGVRDKYAVAKGDPVSMTCNVTAYPTSVTFSWSKDGGSVPGTTTITDEGLGSTLSYTAVAETDYGFYNCTAGNTKGSRSTVIELAADSAPEASTDLRVTMKNSSRYVTVQWTAGFNGGQDTNHTVQYRTGEGAWQDGPQESELASETHPQYTVTFQLPEKTTYSIRIRASNGIDPDAESNVLSVIIEDAKTLYGTLPLTSENFSDDLTDLQSTSAVQLTNRIITELENVFDGILGYEKSTITGYSEGSVVAAFQSVVGESESESAQAAFRTSLTGDQLGAWTVDGAKADIRDTPPNGGDNTTVIIIAVVVSGVVLLAIIAVTVVVVRRKKSDKKQPAENCADNMALDHVRGDADDGYQSLRILHRQTSDHTYQGLTARSDNEITSDGTYEDVKTPAEFPRNQLDIKEELGHGEFGSVFRAEAWKISESSGTTVVAVKELKGLTSHTASTAFFKELSVLKAIGTHPNVVSFLGCCTEAEPFYLLLEFVSGGSLQSTLRTSRTQQTYGNLHGGSKSLSSQDLTKFAWDVAKGMSFLSSKKILHRDLATRNVLVSADRTCKVSDFGLSREGDEYERKTKTRLPVRWMAPESLFHRKYTTKSDVWAFGVLLWEIVTLGATPYPGMSKREVMDGVQQGYRMDKPPHCDGKLYTLMLSCWEADPARRPDFRKVQQTLDTLMEAEHDYINLASLDENTYTSLQNAADEKY